MKVEERMSRDDAPGRRSRRRSASGVPDPPAEPTPDSFRLAVCDGEVELAGELASEPGLGVLRPAQMAPGMVTARSAVTHQLEERARAGRLADDQ